MKTSAVAVFFLVAVCPAFVWAQSVEVLKGAEFISLDTGALKMKAPAPEEKIDKAENERRDMLSAALKKIDALLAKRPGEDAGAPPALNADDQKVVDAMSAWLYTTSVNAPFWDKLQKARDLAAANQKLTGRPPLRRDDADGKDYAYVKDADDPAAGVYFSPAFMNATANCRREVATHEFFHFVVGPQHFYSTKDPQEAIRCPHHLAELVSQIATGVTQSCSSSIPE